MTSSLYRKVPERIGHVAANCGDYVVMYGGYFSHSFAEEYHKADSIDIYNTETGLWQHAVLTLCHPSKSQQLDKHSETDGPSGHDDNVVAAAGLQRMSGACGVHVADSSQLYVYGGHTMEGKSSTLLCIDLRKLTCQKLPDGPMSVDKLAGWHWQKKLFFFGGYGRQPMAGSNGDYLLDMGNGSGYLWVNEMVSYDIVQSTWRYESTKGTPPSPRAAHACALMGTKVYIFGGRSDRVRLNDLHRLDLITMTWSGRLSVHGEDQVPGRSWHSFTAVSDYQVLLYGGFSTQQDVLGDMWLLDVRELSWTRLERNVRPRRQPSLWHTATHCPRSSCVVFFGGCSRNVLSREPHHNNNPGDAEPPLVTAAVFRLSPDTLFRLCFEKVYQMQLHKGVAKSCSRQSEFASTAQPALPQGLVVGLTQRELNEQMVVRRDSKANSDQAMLDLDASMSPSDSSDDEEELLV